MRKIEKLLRKLNRKERGVLLETIKSLFSEITKGLDIKKVKSTSFYRLRAGRFRIIFHHDWRKNNC